MTIGSNVRENKLILTVGVMSLRLKNVKSESLYASLVWVALSAFLFLTNSSTFAGSLAFHGGYSVAENQTDVTITVKRSGVVSGTASVTIISVDGTAKAGSDFTAVNQVLNWGAGDSVDKTFKVTLQDDSLLEGTETFTLRFTSPVGDGTGGDLLVSITDFEEGKIQFSEASFSG